MIQYNFYKLFNPDLGNFNNNQLLLHWKSNGLKENRIYSLDSFFKIYPFFDSEAYKLYNPDLNFNNKIDLMVHWHLYGNKENRICFMNNIDELDLNLKDIKKYEENDIILETNIDSNIDKNINQIENNIPLTYIIISNNLNEINKKLEWINNLEYKNNYIILILNGTSIKLSEINEITNLYIINICFIPTEKYDLVEKYILNKINTKYYSFNDNYPYINKINKNSLNISIKTKNDLIKFPINFHKPVIGIYISDKKIIPSGNFIIKSLSKINFHDMNIILYNDLEKDYSFLLENFHYFYLGNNELTLENFINNCDYLITNNLDIPGNLNDIYKIFLPFDYEITFLLKNITLINDTILDNYFENNILITEFENYILEGKNLYKTFDNNYNKLFFNIKYLEKFNFNYTFSLYKKEPLIIYTKWENNDYGIIKNKNNYYIKFFNKYYLTDLNSIIQNLPLDIDFINIYNSDCIINNIGYILNFKIYIIFIIDNYTNYYILNKQISYFLNDEYNNYEIILYFKLDEFKINEFKLDESKLDESKLDEFKINEFKLDESKINEFKINEYEKLKKIKIIKGDEIRTDLQIYIYLSTILEENSLLLTFKNNIILNNSIINNLIKLENINMLFIAKNLLWNNLYSDILIFKKELLINYNEKYIYLEDYLINTDGKVRLENNLLINNEEELNYYLTINKYNNTNYKSIIDNIYTEIKNNNGNIQYITFINKDTNMENWNKNINNLNESIQINVIEINIKKSEIINSKYINYFYLDSSNLPDFYKNNNALAYNIIIKLLKLYNFDFNFFYFDLLDFNIDKEIVYDINGFDEYNIDFINNFQNKINLYNSKEKSDEIKILFNYLKYKDNINLNIFDNIKTVIINLDERKDRLLYTWEECKKINLNNFERFAGIKIKEINKPLIDNNKAWKKNNIEYLKSATGCKLSHLELLKKYKNCSEDYIMILEDDIIFEENTIIFLNLALIELQDKDWDILYLGSNLIEKEDAVRVGINILEIKNGLTTTAQIFKKSKIDFIIKLIEESDTEIDNTYNLLNNKYSVYPMCVYQRESYSDINKKNMDYGKFHKKFKY